jgi:hypothetical protein
MYFEEDSRMLITGGKEKSLKVRNNYNLFIN